MTTKSWSEEDIKTAFLKLGTDLSKRSYDKLESKPISSSQISRIYGSWGKAKEYILSSPYSKEPEFSSVVEESSRLIITEEDLVKSAKIDLKNWKISRAIFNAWGTTIGGKASGTGKSEQYTNHQVKLYLQERFKEALLEDILKDMDNHSPYYPPSDTLSYRETCRRVMLEVDMMDLHYGKYSWHEETGVDYDLKIAERIVNRRIKDLIPIIELYSPELILLPIGNDLLHVDNASNTTTLGTKQDVDSRSSKIFKQCKELLVRVIDILRNYADVEILVIPGNHDHESLFHMGEVLQAWYRLCDNVKIDNLPRNRKYKRYGCNLLGFTHGDKEGPKIDSLPLIMAEENREDWAEATFKEIHLGHFHKKKEVRFTASDTFGNTIIKFIQSLSGADYWHYSHGFINSYHAVEVFAWDYELGYKGHHPLFAKASEYIGG